MNDCPNGSIQYSNFHVYDQKHAVNGVLSNLNRIEYLTNFMLSVRVRVGLSASMNSDHDLMCDDRNTAIRKKERGKKSADQNWC